MAKLSFACSPSVTTLEPVASNRAMVSWTAKSYCESSSACEMRPDRNPSKHSLNRCADLAANAHPRDEGIRFTSSRRRFCPATTAADEEPSPLFISLLEGQLRHTQTHQLAMTERNTAISRIADVPRSDRRRICQLLAPIGLTEIPALWPLPGAKRASASDLPNNRDL
jgi:hypothetical protein